MCAYQPLLGFRDFYPDDQRVLNYIFDVVRKTALTVGFEEYSSPVLESIELFTAKSGNEIVDQLFNFVDKGGRHVALRPEMTPVVARMIGQRVNAMKKPIKWFNIAENFRYERPQKGRLRSFFQFNIDIFGESSYRADAEIILLTIAIMRNFGLCDFVVRLSDRRLWTLFLLAIGVGECDIDDILCVIDKIEREGEEKTSAALRRICPYVDSLCNLIVEFKSVRSVEALVNFFKGHNLLEFGGVSERIGDLSSLVDVFAEVGVNECVTIDFGIVRGLAYYTGFVFEFFDSDLSSRALAGGGRYDSLAEKLGYCSIPAVGLAIGDVTLRDLLGQKNLLPQLEKVVDCFLVFDEISEGYALKMANELRHRGFSVEYCLHDISFGKQFKLAAQSGAKFAIVCGENEHNSGVVKVKNLFSGDEDTVAGTDVWKILGHD
ncbi:MAG: histidine--tRNA ligase [Puniceicoccales bacterium]|jgi:histidyl-tRNA synthetase|nr:histidine--tRNA ligase [Puniceicoccales bacterium]